ncbi:MAG: DUF4405 domain-containing protein [Gemmatimonadota bacterium]|nr:DUF4405 domain-containing protein [Gemmatimonadota bacterium]
MADDKRKRKTNWRGLTTFITSLSFIVMACSGVILYLTPSGAIAHLTGWTILGLDKFMWVSIHLNACILFLLSSLFHVYFNWRVLVNYFKSKADIKFALKWEFAAALLLCGLFVAGPLLHLSPFYDIFEFRENMKRNMESEVPGFQPGLGRGAGRGRLSGLAGEGYEALGAAEAREQPAALEPETVPAKPLETEHAAAPAEEHDSLCEKGHLSGQGTGRGEGGLGTGRGQGTGIGSGQGSRGIGRMTVAQICETQGLDAGKVLAFFKKQGLDATKASYFRDLAYAMGTTPRKLLEVVSKIE